MDREEGYAFGKVIEYNPYKTRDGHDRVNFKDGKSDCVCCHRHIPKGEDYTYMDGNRPYCQNCASKAPKCVECNGRFFPRSHNAKTCSPECRLKYERRKNYDRIKAYSTTVSQIQNELDSLKKEMEALTTFEFKGGVKSNEQERLQPICHPVWSLFRPTTTRLCPRVYRHSYYG